MTDGGADFRGDGRGVAYGGARRWWQGGVGSGDVQRQGGKGAVGAARARPEAQCFRLNVQTLFKHLV